MTLGSFARLARASQMAGASHPLARGSGGPQAEAPLRPPAADPPAAAAPLTVFDALTYGGMLCVVDDLAELAESVETDIVAFCRRIRGIDMPPVDLDAARDAYLADVVGLRVVEGGRA